MEYTRWRLTRLMALFAIGRQAGRPWAHHLDHRKLPDLRRFFAPPGTAAIPIRSIACRGSRSMPGSARWKRD